MLDKNGYHLDEEKFIESINSSKMIKSITRRQKSEEEKTRKSLEQVKDPSYMEWLSEFIQKHGYVSDSPSFPNPFGSKQDSSNSKIISYLYMIADEYATDNYLNTSDLYNIKYKDHIYEIKLFMGQGGMCFVRENNDSDDYILYDDIISNNKNDRKERISKELNNYREYLMSLLGNDIPECALQETFNDAVKDFKKEKVSKTYKK